MKHANDRRLMAIGTRIRTLRTEQGYSQEAFAAHAGMDRAYYGAVERGERNVASLNLLRIAAALGVEVGELFPRISELPHEPPDAGQPLA
jgi:transcriptional regulator with XRE-family HTH domain